MKPPVSILSPDFKYVPAVSTDVARTFARIRRERRQRAEQQCPSDAADVVIGVAGYTISCGSREADAPRRSWSRYPE